LNWRESDSKQWKPFTFNLNSKGEFFVYADKVIIIFVIVILFLIFFSVCAILIKILEKNQNGNGIKSMFNT
jgi:hypothetical protein